MIDDDNTYIVTYLFLMSVPTALHFSSLLMYLLMKSFIAESLRWSLSDRSGHRNGVVGIKRNLIPIHMGMKERRSNLTDPVE